MCAAGQTACVPRARDGQRSPALLVGRGRNEAWLFRFRRKSRCTVQLEEEGKFSRHSIMSLQGQIALVTGASQGIGRASALALAEAGADAWLCSRNLDRLQQDAKTYGEVGETELTLQMDV